MKRLLTLLTIIVISQKITAQSLQKYGVKLSTWDSIRVSGKLIAINDSIISVESSKLIDNGKVHQIAANKIKDLKIWKKGNTIPFMIVGAAALGLIGSNITEKENGKVAAILTGGAFGAVIGLTGGNLFYTRINKRGLHLNGFEKIRPIL